MVTVDEVNSTIHDAMDVVVARYRRGGAPTMVFAHGNTTVARIASIEFAVTTVERRGRPTSLEIWRRPVDTDIETRVDIGGMAVQEIREAVALRFEEHIRQLARRGVHPFCGEG